MSNLSISRGQPISSFFVRIAISSFLYKYFASTIVVPHEPPRK